MAKTVCNHCHRELDTSAPEVQTWGNFHYCSRACLNEERALFERNRGGTGSSRPSRSRPPS